MVVVVEVLVAGSLVQVVEVEVDCTVPGVISAGQTVPSCEDSRGSWQLGSHTEPTGHPPTISGPTTTNNYLSVRNTGDN